jgi:hypothetical protein
VSEGDAIEPSAAEEFLRDLASSHPGDRQYSDMDRYRDFRAVFLETETGKRVLYEVMSMGRMFRTTVRHVPGVGVDPLSSMINEGKRILALQILTTANIEPKPKPDHANRTKPEGD